MPLRPLHESIIFKHNHLSNSRRTTHLRTNDFEMFEIIPRLYLSKFPESIPSDITHVLNMCTTPHPADPSRTYLHIPMNDVDHIAPHIEKIINFIDTALANNGIVLVHCSLGINRSASAMIAYLCHRDKINSTEALAFLTTKKNDVLPCTLFLKQIDRYFQRKADGKDPNGRGGFPRKSRGRKIGGGVASNSKTCV
jgi:protein-tyrosine phosphatase